MYGVGQSGSQRRGLGVILGVMFLALVLVGLFYVFYAFVLTEDDATPVATEAMAEPTSTVGQAAVVPTGTSSATTSSATATSRSAAATATVTVRPSDTPQPSPTLRPPPEVITVGVRATINISEGLALNLRDMPTLSGSVVITRLVAGTQVDVVGGPENEGDLTWWNVEGEVGQSGWAVEAFGGDTWLVPLDWSDQLPPLSPSEPVATPTLAPTATAVEQEPTATLTPTVVPEATPTATPEVTPTATPVLSPTATPEGGIPSPTVGGRAQVTTQYQFVNLRSAPGLGSEAIGQLENGTIVTIVEGPQEADGLPWWRVEDDEGNVGWAAERVGNEVLLVPVQGG